jgi:hypothetical protein
MITPRRSIAAVAIMLLCAGCFNVTTDITTFDQFRQYKREGPNTLRVMTTDSSVYELETYTLHDSTLEGNGTHFTTSGKSPFTGQLPLSRLVYVQGRETSFGRTLLALAVIGYVGASAGTAGEHQGLRVYRPSSGSCPYVYAWDGNQYVLQGEVFGTAFGKALESSTACMLPAASSQSASVLVRVSNERPETHYIDAMQVVAFEAPEGADVLLDNTQRAWPVLHPQSPLQSPEQLLKHDSIYWMSDLASTGMGGNCRDGINLTFPCPGEKQAGSLIIRGVNTRLANAVYDMVFGYLGDDYLRFLHHIEHDADCIHTLRTWIDEASLTVEVWRGDRWVCEGRIAPEAITADIARIVRISSGDTKGDSIRIRLSSLADLWQLDAVALDWTPAEPLTPRTLQMRTAKQENVNSVSGCLHARDGNYTVLIPGEDIRMEFDRHSPSPGYTVAYALEATGYLYEWPPETGASIPSLFQTVAFEPDQSDRIEVVNFLIRHRDVLLPLVYERWKSVRISAPSEKSQ